MTEEQWAAVNKQMESDLTPEPADWAADLIIAALCALLIGYAYMSGGG